MPDFDKILQYFIFPVILLLITIYFARPKTKVEVSTLQDSLLLKWRDDALVMADKLIIEQRGRGQAERDKDRIQKELDEFRSKCRCQSVNSIEIKLIDTNRNDNNIFKV